MGRTEIDIWVDMAVLLAAFAHLCIGLSVPCCSLEPPTDRVVGVDDVAGDQAGDGATGRRSKVWTTVSIADLRIHQLAKDPKARSPVGKQAVCNQWRQLCRPWHAGDRDSCTIAEVAHMASTRRTASEGGADRMQGRRGALKEDATEECRRAPGPQ